MFKSDYEPCRFHHISMDEIYGTLGDELKELVASLAVDSINLHAAQKMTNEQIKRTDNLDQHQTVPMLQLSY